MACRYNLDIPYIIRGNTKCTLSVFDNTLVGSGKHLIRLDLYPLVAPSYMVRHYGSWDIRLSKVRTDTIKLNFDPLEGGVTIPGRLWPVRIKRQGGRPLREPGYAALHVSLWRISRSNPQLLESRSYPIVLLADSSDFPLKGFNIPVTDRCNLACSMCPRQQTTHLSNADISPDILGPLVEAAAHAKTILLQGFGEPLLYGGLFGLVRHLKERMPSEGRLGLTTNATLLNRQTAGQALSSGLDFLYFSVDGATRATYESIRSGANYDSVLENIRNCVELRGRSYGTEHAYMMNFVVTEDNYGEIADFVRLTASLGVESITFSRCLNTISGHEQRFDPVVLQGLFQEARRLGDHHGINVFATPAAPVTPERCLFMERAVVLSSGEVLPCHTMSPGHALEKQARVFGNVREKPLLAIWNRPDVRKFRRQVVEGDFPPQCDGCEARQYLVP